jgi:hypothetical protein
MTALLTFFDRLPLYSIQGVLTLLEEVLNVPQHS